MATATANVAPAASAEPAAPAAPAAPAQSATTNRPRNRAVSHIGNLILTLASIGGVICIVLVGLAFFFDITLIMFKTGSMSPTIPAGSLAVVREIPASEVRVGDIVTVERPGALPVTHRVTQVEQAPDAAAHARLLTLKGDANPVEDAAPYSVETVRIVLASVPGIAAVVVWFSHPLVLGGLAVGTSILVAWVFWPRGPQSVGPQSASPQSASPQSVSPQSSGRHGRRRANAARTDQDRLATAPHTLVILALLLCAGGAAVANPLLAAAAPLEQIVQGTHVRLVSVGDPVAMESLRPGVPVHWQIGVSAPNSGTGTIDVSLSGTGSTEPPLLGQVRLCPRQWQGADCPGGGELVLLPEHELLTDATIQPLLTMPADAERWFLVEVVLADAAASAPQPPSGVVHLAFHAVGLGDDVSTGGAGIGPLPQTGVSPTVPALAAISAVTVGVCVAALARIRMQLRARTPLRMPSQTPRLTQ